MPTVSARYIVDDVDSAIEFYTSRLGFEVEMHPGPGFAALTRDGFRLYVNATGGPGGASQAMPDGRVPEPGGWNRIQIEVTDLAGLAEKLQKAGVTMRSDIIEGRGGNQVIVDDPAGNPVELFEPKH
ncbi:MAG TPA: VOC family protein [Propionibacteriaceae bacterium]|nr:VOC family protein [Propionibacteriaceae bacterium]